MRSLITTALVLATSASTLHSQNNVSFQLTADNSVYSSTSPGIGDFNKDGKLDVIYAGNVDAGGGTTNGLVMRLGNGDGTFQAPISVGTAGSAIETLKIADLDNDGNPDVVVTTVQNTLEVFFGTGTGAFSAPSITSVTNTPLVIAIGDFNGDHLLDVALPSTIGSLAIYNNVGGRSFVLKSTIQVDSNQNSLISVSAGNLDGSGVQHLAVASYSTAFVLWNDGRENFTKATLLSNPSVFGGANVAGLDIGDLNQDGIGDIIISYDCNANNETPGRSDPTPCQGVTTFYGQGQQRLFQRTLISSVNFVANRSIQAADVNGDGIADVVTAGRESFAYGGVFAFLGHPDGSYDQAPQTFISNSSGMGPAVAGDFNRDGMIDFVAFEGGMETFVNATNRAPCATSTINPTVTTCAPVDNTYLPGPSVRVQANAYDTKQVTALQLYTNGSLTYSQPVSAFNQDFVMNDGSNLLVIKAWDATGLNFRSQRHINVYSGTPGPVCAAAMGTASLCLPGIATSASPVHIIGNGYTATVPTSAQLYIDGREVLEDDGKIPNGGSDGGSSSLDTYQRLTKGSHDVVFKLWDANGHVYSAEKTVAIQ